MNQYLHLLDRLNRDKAPVTNEANGASEDVMDMLTNAREMVSGGDTLKHKETKDKKVKKSTTPTQPLLC